MVHTAWIFGGMFSFTGAWYIFMRRQQSILENVLLRQLAIEGRIASLEAKCDGQDDRRNPNAQSDPNAINDPRAQDVSEDPGGEKTHQCTPCDPPNSPDNPIDDLLRDDGQSAELIEEDDSEFLHIRYYADTGGVLGAMVVGLKAADISYDRVSVVAREDTNVLKAIKMLSEQNTTCLCVESITGSLMGVLDMADAAAILMMERSNNHDMTIRDCLKHCTLASKNASLVSVVSAMQQGWSYVAVDGETQEAPYHIVSIGRLIRYLHASLKMATGLYHDQLESPLSSFFPYGYTQPITISHESKARSAIACMLSSGTRCLLAIEENTGAPVCVMSMSDVKVLSKVCEDHESLDRLLDMTLPEFVQVSRAAVGVQRDLGSVVSCSSSDSLISVIKKFVSSRVRTLYVMCDDGSPIGMLSDQRMLSILIH